MFATKDYAEIMLHYEILKKVYSLPQEEYEAYYETDMSWQLPYLVIKDYLRAVSFVLGRTLDIEAPILFIKQYYEKQSEYKEEYRLSALEYELLIMVVEEECKRNQFSETIVALLVDPSFLKPENSELDEYLYNKAQEFINSVSLKDEKLPKRSDGNRINLLEELDKSEAFYRIFDYNLHSFNNLVEWRPPLRYRY